MAYFDRYETRTPRSRDLALFRDLRGILSVAKPRAPALRAQLKGVALADLRSRGDLAKIPLIRKSELPRLQEEQPPFGGLVATRAGALARLLMSPGPMFEPEGLARDWWGAARAMTAAEFERGDIVLNCFSYHLTPGGHVMDCGAKALGCAVIPAGTAPVEQQLQAIAHYQPVNYCGTPDFLMTLLERADAARVDISSLKRALVSGAALPQSLRDKIEARGVMVRQAYASADLGVIAFETHARGARAEGMVVNESVIVEIVRPGSDEPAPFGEVGEMVVTRLNADYPLLRFATGDLSKFLAEPPPCGRTNTRINGWMGRADQSAKVKGLFVHPTQIAEVGRRHPMLGRLRLVISRADEQDMMVLQAETATREAALANAIAADLQAVTKLKGAVELVAPGALPNDGKTIADERPVG